MRCVRGATPHGPERQIRRLEKDVLRRRRNIGGTTRLGGSCSPLAVCFPPAYAVPLRSQSPRTSPNPREYHLRRPQHLRGFSLVFAAIRRPKEYRGERFRSALPCGFRGSCGLCAVSNQGSSRRSAPASACGPRLGTADGRRRRHANLAPPNGRRSMSHGPSSLRVQNPFTTSEGCLGRRCGMGRRGSWTS